MIGVSQNYLTALNGDIRHFQSRITLNDGATVFEPENLQSVVINEKLNVDGDLTMGCSCSSQATLMVFKDSENPIPWPGSKVFIEIGLELADETYEWIPMGVFYVSNVKSFNPVLNQILAYDGMCKLEDQFDANGIEWPATPQSIIAGIEGATGISVDPSYNWIPYENYTIALDQVASNYTNRAMVGYIAGMMGKSAIFDRNGNLTFRWFADTEREIGLEMQYANGFTKSTDSDIAVYSVTSGTRENPYSAGDGVGVTFVNPFVTQEIVDSIQENVEGLAYLPSTIKWRGDPAIEAGDIVAAEWLDGSQHDVLVMGHTVTFNGGVYSTIACHGQSDTVVAMSQSPTDQKIELAYNGLTKAFQSATEKISGGQGGYWALEFDNNKFPTGWHIADTPTVLPTSNLWRFNFSGLAFSSNGGATYTKVALTNDGQINADMITTGQLNANRLVLDNGTGTTPFTKYIRANGGTMEFGATDSVIRLRLSNDTINFVDEKEAINASFTPTSFEIDDPNMVRFGKFAFILHPSGNFSITRVVW